MVIDCTDVWDKIGVGDLTFEVRSFPKTVNNDIRVVVIVPDRVSVTNHL